MHFSLASLVLATLASTVSAANTQVEVGANGTFTFNPPSVNASTGDTVTFVFNPKNHTVTQSTFAAPCQPMSNGVDSDFQPVAANATNVPSFSVTVNNTQPVWFFCKQTGHCEEGMVFAINPTQNKSFDAFQAAAKASSSNGTPASNSSSGSGSGSGSNSAASTGTATGSTPSSSSRLCRWHSTLGCFPFSFRLECGGL
ncbi:Cupredoxin [Russula emetica]|nr:Cupredoxin [Russula emetica]